MTTITDKITLNDTVGARKEIKASKKNINNLRLMSVEVVDVLCSTEGVVAVSVNKKLSSGTSFV